MNMSLFSYYYKPIIRGFISIFICSYLVAKTTNCSICLQPLDSTFSIDAWGNAFHSDHEQEGIFCHSCSRIISQRVTQGGYMYSDGRHLCSLCKITAVNNDSVIQAAYKSVILQFKEVGLTNISSNIPISLVDLHQLNQKAGELSHVKLKGITHTKPAEKQTNPFIDSLHILILFGLPRIEFEAVLAHELLHCWLYQNKVSLSQASTEGFCNLGRYLIYKNDNTYFSTIHLYAMNNDHDLIYGKEYRKMRAKLEENGWEKLITILLK